MRHSRRQGEHWRLATHFVLAREHTGTPAVSITITSPRRTVDRWCGPPRRLRMLGVAGAHPRRPEGRRSVRRARADSLNALQALRSRARAAHGRGQRAEAEAEEAELARGAPYRTLEYSCTR